MNKKVYIYILVAVAVIIVAGIYVDKSVKINVAQPNPVSNNVAQPNTVSGDTSNIAQSNSAGNKSSGAPVTLGDYGQVPNFPTGDTWLNSQPLTISDLKGKVVLVDFWTYSCINCIRTLPYVTKWYDTYNKDGLVVVGVHTPEFTFEHDTNNVKNAIAQFGIHYPVVQDNDYAIWNSYNNEYWPAEYLINQKGEIVHENFGEGNYAETENDIRYLLGLSSGSTITTNQTAGNLSGIGSPEMYFDTERVQYLTPEQQPSSMPQNYTENQNLTLNTFSLGGKWQFTSQNATLVGSSGQINLKFHSGKLYMVAASPTPAMLQITVDGKVQPSVTVQASKLYTLFNSQDYSDHIVQINITGSGFEAFTFTFG